MLIGARPHTDWLPAEIARDAHGFLLTGEELADDDGWPLERRPLSLETSMPGVLAAGDVRHASVKRVASAVGEGSIAVQLVHSLLADERLHPRRPGRRPQRSRAAERGHLFRCRRSGCSTGAAAALGAMQSPLLA